MIAVVFTIEEPHDVELTEAIVDSIVEAGNLELGRLGLELKGFIAVDKAADEVFTAVLKTQEEEVE